MKVTLLNHTPNPEETIAMAAKLCYSPSEIEDLKNGLTKEKTEKFIDRLVKLGHESPFEHVTFTFGIEGGSRSLTHQLVRHRIASYSQQSQRYVDAEGFEYVTPLSIRESTIIHRAPDDIEYTTEDIFTHAMKEAQGNYVILRDDLYYSQVGKWFRDHGILASTDNYRKFKEEHKKEANAMMKKACEDARYVLPNATTTKIICTFNVRSLWNFFKHRLCNRAQWEIREVAEEMLKLCLKEAPLLFSNCAPSCVYGKCGEGSMSCGKQKEVKNKYDELLGEGTYGN